MNGGKRLIAFNESFATWMTPEEVQALIQPGRLNNFADITDHPVSIPVDNLLKEIEITANAIPTRPIQQAEVGRIIRDFLCAPGADCAALSWATVVSLSAYRTRWHTQPTGREAVEWLRDQYRTAAGARLGRDISVELFAHTWVQPSLIVRMTGRNPQLASQIVIIGGHIDSTAGAATAVAPGADDDASGSATVFSAFTSLVRSGFVPDRTVEFHAYAAEEAGLLGSAAVAALYRRENRNVVTMTQFDMVCYSPRRTVGITSDFTNPQLSSFITQLITSYTNMQHAPSRCGYACSDHGSWNRNNYAAAFPFETPFGQQNPNIHTARDTLANCDRQYMGEFVKLAVSYVVEMGLASA